MKSFKAHFRSFHVGKKKKNIHTYVQHTHQVLMIRSRHQILKMDQSYMQMFDTDPPALTLPVTLLQYVPPNCFPAQHEASINSLATIRRAELAWTSRHRDQQTTGRLHNQPRSATLGYLRLYQLSITQHRLTADSMLNKHKIMWFHVIMMYFLLDASFRDSKGL